MSRSGGSTFKRCGCRDQRTGRQLGQRCRRLCERGHGSWYLAIELSAAPAGQRSRVRLGGYATRAAAQAALGRLATPGGQGRRSYQHHLDTYLLPRIGTIPLVMLTAADLRAMFTAIGRQRPATGAPLSAATLARIRATLRAALNAAIREGLISANPAKLVELPPLARPHPVVWTVPREAAWRESDVRPAVAVWTAEQTARFLAAIRDEPLYPCYHLMAVSGLRRGEAAGLRWCDIDFAAAILTVSRQLQESGRGLVVLPPKSIASNRVLALDPWTVQVLAAHRDRQLSAPCDGYVFARPGGRPYTPGYLTRRFIRLIRRAGLPTIRLHDLRHGAATLALAGGADLKAIQALLGHASIILTADTYTSVLPDLARTTAKAVATQIIKAARTPPGLTTAPPWPHTPAA